MEEVGLPAEILRPLGKLPPLVTRTGFEVFPCVASLPPGGSRLCRLSAVAAKVPLDAMHSRSRWSG